tara:strand:- start:270 stop:953 length:684 start_codon:yes stop_codon:yes gene_type:complete
MSNFIEDFLYMNAPQPRSFYAQEPFMEGVKAELSPKLRNMFGVTSKFPYEGYDPNFQGEGKAGRLGYNLKGLESLFRPVQGIGGGTAGSRIIYENILRQLGNVNRFANMFTKVPVIGAASDALFGTNYTMGTVNDINNLINMITPTQQAQPEPEPTIAQQQAQTQQNIINQINQANQNNQGGGGGGGNVSGPAGMSGPSSSPRPRRPNLRNRAQGGLVSINDMIGRM